MLGKKLPTQKLVTSEQEQLDIATHVKNFIESMQGFVKESNTFIETKIYNKNYLQGAGVEANVENLYGRSILLFNIFTIVMKGYENKTHDQNYNTLYKHKQIILDLHKNTMLCLIVQAQFTIKQLQSAAQDKTRMLIVYFNILEKPRNKAYFKNSIFLTVREVSKNFGYYMNNQQKLLESMPLELLNNIDKLVVFCEKARGLFLAMKHIAQDHPAISDPDVRKDLDGLANNVVEVFNRYLSIIERLQKNRKIAENLKDPKIEKLLLAEEQAKEIKESKLKAKMRNIEFAKAVKKKLKPRTIAKVNIEQSQVAQPIKIDPIQSVIEDHKYSIDKITNVEKLKEKVTKISELEVRAINNGQPLSVNQELELAECLVLSSLFAQNIINKKDDLESLNEKVLDLCQNALNGSDEQKLRSNIIMADLHSNYALILNKKCNNKKYNFVKDVYGKLFIIITPGLAFEKITLIRLLKEAIDNMQLYVNNVNGILAKVAYPDNPDGISFSIAQYAKIVNDYNATIIEFENQNKLAKRQREQFLLALHEGLIPLKNDQPFSLAAHVHALLRFETVLIGSLRGTYEKSTKSVKDLDATFKTKYKLKSQPMIKANNSLRYLDNMVSFANRKRTASISTISKPSDEFDVLATPSFARNRATSI
jgi:hypothetical protein